MTKIIRFLLIPFFLVIFLTQSWAVQKGGRGELISTFKTPLDAQVVEVGFFPLGIHSVYESMGTYNVDFYMWMRWKGDRDPTENFNFMNSVNKWGMTKQVLHKSPVKLDDGTFYQLIQIEGTFQETFSLGNFPLDKHHLTIKIEDNELDASKLIYVIDSLDSGYSNQLKLPGWNVIGWDYNSSIFNYESLLGERNTNKTVSPKYSLLSFNMIIERPPGFFAWKLLLPLIVVLLSGLIALMLSPSDSSTRIFMPSTALLTLVFLQQSYSSTLPSVSGLVLLDKIYVVAYILTLLSLGWIIKATSMMDRSEGAAIVKIRQLDRYMMAIIIGTFCIAAAFLVLAN